MFHRIESFLFPPYCLHCNSYDYQGRALFCPLCSYFFDPLEPTNEKVAACFSYEEAVSTFVKTIKNRSFPYLSKVAASILLLQAKELGWPLPEIIIPVPSRSFFKRRDPIYLMAKYLARSLEVSFGQPLQRKRGRPKQALLSQEERMTLAASDFEILNPKVIRNRSILLIDDVMTTRSTFRALTDLLYQGEAREVYCLALAESVLQTNSCP